MPSKKLPRKKAFSKDEVHAISGAMQSLRERLTHGLDEQAISSMFNAARNGSASHISMVGQLVGIMPEIHIAEAVSIMCTVLDVPAFPPEKALPASLTSTRSLAYESLQSLSQIPDNYSFDKTTSLHFVLVKNWPMICNWMKYFISEHARSHSPSDPISTIDFLNSILNIVPGIINNVARCGRLTLENDDVLHLLIKVWLRSNPRPDDTLFSATFHRCCCLLSGSLKTLDQTDDSGMRLAKVAQYVYHEAGGDVGMVTRKLLQHIETPLEACKEWPELVASSLKIILYLTGTEDKLMDEFAAKFMNSSLKDGLVPLLARLFLFLSDQVTSTPDKQILSGASAAEIMRAAFRLTFRSACSQNGQHWTTVLFDLGFLRALARILSSDHVIDEFITEVLAVLFGTVLPGYLCHRFVLRSALKAVKKLAASGDIKSIDVSVLRDPWIKSIDVSVLRDPWTIFTNVLLERTVINAVINRDFPNADVRKCENCSKLKKEASLRKCAGCKTTMYCSMECQIDSWKAGDHRTECKKMQEMWYLSGMTMPKGEIFFLDVVALAELRRHLPGVTKHLATIINPRGISLEDAILSVSFVSCPPVISVRPGGRVLSRDASRDGDDDSGAATEDAAKDRKLNGQVHLQPKWLEMNSLWGGTCAYSIMQRIPPYVELFSADYKYAGDDMVENAHLLLRKPAQDDKGKDLRFVLDDVDRHVMHARKHFRPPTPGNKKAPKTIYDYVEARVAADPFTMSWLGTNNQAGAEDLLSEDKRFQAFLANAILLALALPDELSELFSN